MVTSKWDELCERLEIRFTSLALLRQAFTHASYRNEHKRPSLEDNERLEFLGDAVLELIVSEFLYKTKPTMPEGELTRMRAAIVCEPTLVRFARDLQFDQFIRLGRGEERSGGRNRAALLADVFEAFIGALYLDQGLEPVRVFLDRYVFPKAEAYANLKDYKTTLQEWVQQHDPRTLRYVIAEERGPAHAKEFVVQVLLGDTVMGEGSGRSKKEAEQQAASMALTKLSEHHES
ncbi:ribonuclease III [Alicyclobacillus ferrooxydans]|uniref:Ribonuclease 3 n=1 Tax=Alicyclobacillus ferrooxydans TaxID=471514 RepID=A0A0P9GVR5_9BACL|nr:ribonuclease III [Alicyclobacillus ferrooxydans]KPV45370.1 ribonuclease III [Alicyclobacillus ferrooxydans]